MEASTGSLGQGLSVGIGMALAGKLNGAGYRVYVMLGDGECEEGQVWEAAMSAAAHKLDNLVAILDYNKCQLDGPIREILNWEPVPEKWAAFGWHVIEVDGHDIPAILRAFAEAGNGDRQAGVHRGAYRQRPGRLLHGRQQRMARQGAERGRMRASAGGISLTRETITPVNFFLTRLIRLTVLTA